MINTTHASNRSTRPIALAIAMTLALGMGTTAQAQQYSYPGSASSSGNAARASVREARATEVHDRYHAPRIDGGRVGDTREPVRQAQPSKANRGNGYGYPNGTVHPIVAKPTGHGGHLAEPSEPRHEPARGYPQGGYGSNGNDYAHGTVHPIVAKPTEYGGRRAVTNEPGHEPARSPQGGNGGNSRDFTHGTVHPIVAQPRDGRGLVRPESRESSGDAHPGPHQGAGHGGPGHPVGGGGSGYGAAQHYPNSTVPRERTDVHAQARDRALAPQASHGNPSMQRGEACPVGECGHAAPSSSASDSGSTYPHSTQTPVRAMPNRDHLDAVTSVRATAGRPDLRPSVGNSRAGVGSRGPAMTSVAGSAHVGQTSRVTGGVGQQHQYGAPTHSYGNPGAVNPYGGPSGGVHRPNGGSAGNASGFVDTIKHAIGIGSDKSSGSSGTRADEFNASQQIVEKTTPQANGQDMQPGKSYPVKDPNSVTIGPKSSSKEGGGVGDDISVGDRGPGTLVNSGTGKGVNPGHRPGQDSGGAGHDTGDATGGTGSNRNNATGAYVVTNKNGQDIPVKPKVQGAFKADSNGVKGVTDPKRGGSAGGGGG